MTHFTNSERRLDSTDSSNGWPRILSAFILFLLAGSLTAGAQANTTNMGYFEGSASYPGTLNRSQPTATYWFFLRNAGMNVNATVQDVDGRGIDQATLFDAAGKVKAESRNRIGAQIGARGLSSGWHRLFVRSSKDNHRYRVSLDAHRQGMPADVGNNFNSTHSLGTVGQSGSFYPNYIGPGDSADVYRFTLGNASNHLELSLLNARRDGAFLELYRREGNQPRLVKRAAANGGNTPLIIEKLSQGSYYARVTPASSGSGLQGTPYRIYATNRNVVPDPGGDLQNPGSVQRVPTRSPVRESVTPQVDSVDAFRFQVPPGPGGGANDVTVSFAGSSSEYAVYLIQGGGDNIIANNTTAGANQKNIRRSLSPGTYKAMIITQGRGNQAVDYQLNISAQTAASTRPGRPTTPGPSNSPVGQISYGGFLYADHSANTAMTPTTIPLGGTFQITSNTMRFSGPNTGLRVVLEVQNRRPGSGGVTRLQLTNVSVSGNTLTVAGPDLAPYGNQQYRVVVVTFTNRRPDSYASPGLLTVQ